jgi:uncharacterized protein (TIGR02099 family)
MGPFARFLAGTLRVLVIGGVGLLLCAALYVSLGRQLVPMVAEYRGELQDRLSAALHQPVRIGRLEGRWSGFAPELLARDVTLGEAESPLRLDRVQLLPDLLQSLLHRQLRVADLQLSGLQLALVEGEDGRWAVRGMPHRDDGPLQPDVLLRQLQQVARVSLLDSQVTLLPRGEAPFTLDYVDLTLRGEAPELRLDGRLVLPDGQPLALRADARVQPQRWQQASARLYLSLPQSDWARWLPGSLTGDWHLQRLQAGGEVWLDWSDGAVQRAVARLHAPQVQAGYRQRADVTLHNLALNAYFRSDGHDQQLLIDSLAMDIGETRWGDVKLLAVRHPADAARQEQVELTADRIDLAPLAPLVQALAPLPERAAEALAMLQPHGSLHNLSLSWRPQAEGAARLQYAANLERVGFAAYHAVPAAENVSGSLTGDLAHGELRLAAEDFSLHLPQLFPEPWHYRQTRAKLDWRLDDESFTLSSPYVRAEGEEGSIAGDLFIRLMRDPNAESYMDLRVALKNGDGKYTARYLPTRSPAMSPALSEWLTTAIRGGAVDEGFFEYQGALMHAEPGSRTLNLFFKVHDAELAFQPGWPALRQAAGDVFIQDGSVRVELAKGQLLDSRIGPAEALVPHVPGQVPHLQLSGEVDGSVGDGLKILRDTPLGASGTFAGWQGDGPLDGHLQLDVPLAKGQPPRVQVSFATQGARLQLGGSVPALSDLSGRFRYDSARGLSADAVRAQAFGRALRGSVQALGNGGAPRSLVDASGTAPLKSLTDWLGVSQPLPASGELPYHVQVEVGGPSLQLRLDSDLKGLAVDLPAPFGKPAEQSRPLAVKVEPDGEGSRYRVDYQDAGALVWAAPKGALAQGRGELVLGGQPAGPPADKGLVVRGRLGQFDLSAWQDALRRYAPANGERGAAGQLLNGADLHIDHLLVFGRDFADVGLRLDRRDAAWQMDIDSPVANGRVGVPDDRSQPIQVELQTLRLPQSDEEATDADRPDALADVDPHVVPALDVHIAQVLQGDASLGAWSLKARPTPQGVRFEALDLGLKGLQLTGDAGWEGTAGASHSWYKGRLEGSNLEKVLLAWDFAPNVTSERFRLDVDGRWPGSPAWASLKRLSGSLDMRLNKGQFVEVQGTASALRVFGLLNFNSIGRRLRLDFSDLLGKGLSYDSVKGVLDGEDGVYHTREPITLDGPSSDLVLSGTLDMQHDQVDAKLLVTLPLTNNLPMAALIVGAPAIGGALFVFDKLLGDRVARFATVHYAVSGAWQDPQIELEKPFDKP